MSREQFGPLFSPHDDVPRWPAQIWLRGIADGLQSQLTTDEINKSSIYLNNLALLAVHARDPVLARDICHLQLLYLCGVYRVAQQDGSAVEAMVQPILNLARLKFRSAPRSEWSAESGFSDPCWIPLEEISTDLNLWRQLRESLYRSTISTVVDNVIARELAVAVIRGNLPADTVFETFGEMRPAGGKPPSSTTLAVLNEALVHQGYLARENISKLHPLIAAIYLMRLGADQRTLPKVLQNVEAVLSIRPCSRALCEISAEILRLIKEKYGHIDKEMNLRIIDYAREISDEYLFIVSQRILNDHDISDRCQSLYVECPGREQLRLECRLSIISIAQNFQTSSIWKDVWGKRMLQLSP